MRFDGVEAVNTRHLLHPIRLLADVVRAAAGDEHGWVSSPVGQKDILAVKAELKDGAPGLRPGVKLGTAVDETADDLENDLPVVSKLLSVRVKVPALSRFGRTRHDTEEQQAAERSNYNNGCKKLLHAEPPFLKYQCSLITHNISQSEAEVKKRGAGQS